MNTRAIELHTYNTRHSTYLPTPDVAGSPCLLARTNNEVSHVSLHTCPKLLYPWSSEFFGLLLLYERPRLVSVDCFF